VSAEIEDVTGYVATLKPGNGGVFDIRCDGKIIFQNSKPSAFPMLVK